MIIELTRPSFDLNALEVAIAKEHKRYVDLVFSLEAMVMRGEMHEINLLQKAKHMDFCCRELILEIDQAHRRSDLHSKVKFYLRYTDQILILQDGLNYQLDRYEQLMAFVAKKDDAVIAEYAFKGYARIHELHSTVVKLYAVKYFSQNTQLC